MVFLAQGLKASRRIYCFQSQYTQLIQLSNNYLGDADSLAPRGMGQNLYSDISFRGASTEKRTNPAMETWLMNRQQP